MHSYKSLFVILLGTTALISLPALAETEIITGTTTDFLDSVVALDDGAKSDVTFALIDNDIQTSGTTTSGTSITNVNLSQGTLTIRPDATKQGERNVYGPMGVGVISGAMKPTLNVLDVGQYVADEATHNVSVNSKWTSSNSASASSSGRAAITVVNADLVSKGSTFADSHNTTTDSDYKLGGAIRLRNGANLVVTHSDFDSDVGSVFYNNSAAHGGAIAMGTGADTATGAYPVENITANISDSIFKSNKASITGGAIDVNNRGATATLTNNYFWNNAATGTAAETGTGGAIDVDGTISSMSGNEFYGNTATNEGGAIYVDEGSIGNATGNTYTANSAKSGGAIYVKSGSVNATGETITNNSATQSGGGVYNAGLLNLTNTTLSGNTAAKGGAIYNAGNATVSGTTQMVANTASLGSNLYNDTGATFNVVDVHDTIDLDYAPHTETPAPATMRTLFDQSGDIYNAGTLNFTNSEVQLHNGVNTNSSLTGATRKVGTVNVNNSRIDLGGDDVPGEGVIYGDRVNINANSTIQTHVNTDTTKKFGHVEANTISVDRDGTQLAIVVGGRQLDPGETRDYAILDAPTVTGGFANKQNNVYDIIALKDDAGNDTGVYRISAKGPKTQYCFDGNCDQNENNTAEGWLTDSFDDSATTQDIYNKLNYAYQYGNGCETKEYRDALDGLAPDVSPLVQAHATEITRRLAAITSERFYNSMERTGYVHNGKRFYRFPRHDSNLWVQGLYGKSKYSTRKGWDMTTKGLALGFDGHIDEALRMGVSYAYTTANGDSVGRETDIKSHTGMVYGEYNPNRFYANWLAMYTRSQYDEEKKVFNHKVTANYDVDAIAAQVMLGRKMGPYVSGNWASGVIKPEVGLRYLYTKQHGYTDSIGQKVGSASGQTLTGILGAQYTIGYTLSPTLSWYPELRAALTYDVIEPDTKMRVNLRNGSTYEVKTENMDRFGIEIGAKVGLDINRKAEIALEYEGIFKGDYKNHMGLANLKYKF